MSDPNKKRWFTGLTLQRRGKMSDLNSDLNLEEFIYQVKKELLDAQEKHKSELGYFNLENVELEVTVTAERTSKGDLDLHVVQIGSSVSKEHVHSVKLTFSIVQRPEESKDNSYVMEAVGGYERSTSTQPPVVVTGGGGVFVPSPK